jgi:hypothetical protein
MRLFSSSSESKEALCFWRSLPSLVRMVASALYGEQITFLDHDGYAEIDFRVSLQLDQ